MVDRAVSAEQQTMPLENVFWSHFSRNLGPSTWVIGVLVSALGLGFGWGLAIIVIGNVIGAVPVAFCAVLGPKTGLTQMEISRFAFGRLGTRLPSFLNWVCCVGWDAVNNVPSTLALVALLAVVGVSAPFWAALAALAGLQLIASIYGHDVVQLLQKYLGWVLLVVFVAVGVMAVAHGGSLVPAAHPATAAVVLLGISLVASFNLGWAPYAADYTRYLPKSTPSTRVFAASFLGTLSSIVGIECCGLLTAARIPDTTPSALIASIEQLTGGLAPVALFAIALASVAVNSQNDNTAAYSFLSAGFRLPRYASAVITAALGYLLAVVGAGQFALLYANYLVVLVYWIAPWVGIVLADSYMRHGDDGAYRQGWDMGASLFVAVTIVTIALFSSTAVYVGPVAKMLGGTDIGYLVGFVVAAGITVAMRARPLPVPRKAVR